MSRAAETTCAQAKELRREETMVHAIRKEQHTKRSNKQRSQREKNPDYKFVKCGGNHEPMSCPAFGKSCHNCWGNNHFSKCCRVEATNKKKVHAIDEEPEELFVDSVQINKADKDDE